jgi:hypothetical protein
MYFGRNQEIMLDEPGQTCSLHFQDAKDCHKDGNSCG